MPTVHLSAYVLDVVNTANSCNQIKIDLFSPSICHAYLPLLKCQKLQYLGIAVY